MFFYGASAPPPQPALGNFGSPETYIHRTPSLHLNTSCIQKKEKMAKHAANKGKASVTNKNNKRKRDAQSNKQEDAPVALFAAVKDTELDDIFAKSVSISRA